MKQIKEIYINPLDGSKTIEYDDNSVEIVTVDNSTTYVAPPAYGSGLDDTTRLQSYLDEMSAAALLENKPRTVSLPKDQTYLVQGIVHPEFITIDGNFSKLVKTAGYSGSGFTSPTFSAIRAKWVKKNNSWYGSNRNMGLKNIVIDGNNQNYTALIDYLNVEDFTLENVTAYAGAWSIGWTIRLSGKRIQVTNPTVLGATRVYQDGLHIMYGEDIHVQGGYIVAGDDAVAAGDDAVLSNNLYMDDQGLTNFTVEGTKVVAIRGAGVKVYTAAVSPFSTAPNNYVGTGFVSGGKISVEGKAGLLRNGGVSLFSHASVANRNLEKIQGIEVNANLIVGTDGKSVYSAVAGTIVGNPTAVTRSTSAQVTLNNHNLVSGDVVVFYNIPTTGMQQLVNFYQVRSNNLSTNTFELADNAYRNNVGLDSTSFANWTSGTLIKASTGSGYVVGDILTLSGGTFIEPAEFKVIQVGPTGDVRAVIPVNFGNYSVLPPVTNNVTGGSGTGAVLHLELTHSGVNAYGVLTTAAKGCKVSGTLKINDTVSTATRFNVAQLVDSQAIKLDLVSNVPELGGVWVLNESTTVLRSKDNEVTGYYTCGPTISSSAGMFLFSNSQNCKVSGVWENVPSNTSAVRAILGGNQLGSKTITAISSANPSVFTVTGHNRKVNDLVLITSSVLSSGDLNNKVYRVRSVVDANNITLKELDNTNLTIGSATVTTGGILSLAINSVDVSKMTVRKAPSATTVAGVSTFSNTPPRATQVTVRDCDFNEVDIPVSDTTAQCPIFFSENNLGLNETVRSYLTGSVIHNMAVSDKIIVNVPSAPVTISAPVNPRKGQTLEVVIVHPAGTVQTITWDAVFRKVADGTAAANSYGVTRFIYNGTNWLQIGGALTYSTL